MDMKLNRQNLPFGANIVNTNGSVQTSNQASQNPMPLLYYQYGGLPNTSTAADQRQTQLLNAMQQLEAQHQRTNQTLSPQISAPVNIMMPPSLNPAAILSMAATNTDDVGKDTKSKFNSAIEAESKRQKRLELNRRSAQLSRQRKKERLYELERTVNKLTVENQELLRANEALKNIIKQQEKTVKNDTESKDGGTTKEQTSDAIQSVLSSLLEENRALKQKLESLESSSKTAFIQGGVKLLEKRKFMENGTVQSSKKQKD